VDYKQYILACQPDRSLAYSSKPNFCLPHFPGIIFPGNWAECEEVQLRKEEVELQG
jgi:hypothetical protein